MTDLHEALRDDVRMLGKSLGETIESHLGSEFLEKIENVRKLAKEGRNEEQPEHEELLQALQDLGAGRSLSYELPDCTDMYSVFLNLLVAEIEVKV